MRPRGVGVPLAPGYIFVFLNAVNLTIFEVIQISPARVIKLKFYLNFVFNNFF